VVPLLKSLCEPPTVAASAGPAIAAAVAALVVFAVTLGGTYVYDDIGVVQGDPRLVAPIQWGKLWTQGYSPDALDNLYRPLVSMTYAVQWWLHGDRPWAFHAVNWILHAAVAAAVAEFCRRGAGRATAYIAGLLFAVHPIHVEAVANIVGRAELCCALGTFGALILMTRRPLTVARAAGIIVCSMVAVLSKEQGILIPLLLLIFGWFVWRPMGEVGQRERSVLRWLVIVITWSVAGYLIGREHFLKLEWNRDWLDWGMQPMVRSFGLDRWLMPVVLLGHYVQLLVFPLHLSPDYGAAVIGSSVHWSDPYLWLGVAAGTGWIIAALWMRGFAMFCLLALAVTYGVVGNILTLIGTNMAERLMYLPSAFFLMLIGMGLAKLPRGAILTIMVVLLSAASLRSFTYARRWNDRLGFYVQSLAEQPRSTQLHLLVADEYLKRGDLPAAMVAAQHGTDDFPDYWKVWLERTLVAMKQNRLENADQYLDRAFHLSPNGMVTVVGLQLQDLKSAAAAPRK
jgi:protein O-mannosyl-transferase